MPKFPKIAHWIRPTRLFKEGREYSWPKINQIDLLSFLLNYGSVDAPKPQVLNVIFLYDKDAVPPLLPR